MFPRPGIASQLASQRHHDLQAQAGQQRLQHQLRQDARAARPAGQTVRRITQLLKRIRSAALPSS
jgi:hypothetical protein